MHWIFLCTKSSAIFIVSVYRCKYMFCTALFMHSVVCIQNNLPAVAISRYIHNLRWEMCTVTFVKQDMATCRSANSFENNILYICVWKFGYIKLLSKVRLDSSRKVGGKCCFVTFYLAVRYFGIHFSRYRLQCLWLVNNYRPRFMSSIDIQSPNSHIVFTQHYFRQII